MVSRTRPGSTPGGGSMRKIVLDLTEKEAAFLEVACNEYFHRIKELRSDEIYGAFIADEKVLCVKSLWKKVELAVGVNTTDYPVKGESVEVER